MNLQLLSIVFLGLLARHGRLRRQEGGASVLEWAMIAAVVVAAAAGLGIVISKIVSTKGEELKNCSSSPGAC